MFHAGVVRTKTLHVNWIVAHILLLLFSFAALAVVPHGCLCCHHSAALWPLPRLLFNLDVPDSAMRDPCGSASSASSLLSGHGRVLLFAGLR